MGLTEYDNAEKWWRFFRRSPRWLRICTLVLTVALLSVFVYAKLGPYRKLSTETAQLKRDLSEAQTKITELRDKRDELHREILYHKNLVAPLQKRAEQLYPELETAAALAKLAEDVQTVRSLATQDRYKQLSPARQQLLVGTLKALRAQHENPPTIILIVEQGNSPRMRVANDLKAMLNAAGFAIEFQSQQTFRRGVAPDVSMSLNPSNTAFAMQLAKGIGTAFINCQFAGHKNDKTPKSAVTIKINGDPLFSEDGVVTFR